MRVFVSSTSVDLLEHRRAVAEVLERLGLEFRRMEGFGARPDDPTHASLDEVEASDLFVGIYAHRYGYVPEGASCSITESEFEHATQLHRPTFCYLVDPNFPWPIEFLETDATPRLQAFKERIEKVVVRDTFTTPDVLATRVSAALGRYLIADPRRHGARTAADHAKLTLADASATVFVDIMRLASVAGSDRAREVNAKRYEEFVDIADAHLADLRTRTTRLGSNASFDLTEYGDAVELGIEWALLRLRRSPFMNPPWNEFMAKLLEVAERVEALGQAASLEYYTARRSEVAEIIHHQVHRVAVTQLRDPDTFVSVRFAAQTAIISELRERGGFSIATVRDDIDRRIALPYFIIDLTLLRRLGR